MKYQHIVLDAQNAWWRAFLGAVGKCVIEDENELAKTVLSQAFKLIRDIQARFGYADSKIYLLFDNPQTVISIRKLVDPEYKSTRLKKSVPKGIYEVLSIFIEMLKMYSDNYFIMKAPSLEADDLTYSLIKSLTIDRENRCLVISNDLDWSRNIQENVHWWNYSEVYNPNSFKKEFGYDPSFGKAVQLYKAIRGDKSDNIKLSVPRLPEKVLIDLVNRFTDVDDLYKNMWKDEVPYSKEWKLKLKECENEVRRNCTLTDFILLDLNINEYIIKCRRVPKLLKVFFQSFDLSLEKDMIGKEDKANFFKPKKVKHIK